MESLKGKEFAVSETPALRLLCSLKPVNLLERNNITGAVTKTTSTMILDHP